MPVRGRLLVSWRARRCRVVTHARRRAVRCARCSLRPFVAPVRCARPFVAAASIGKWRLGVLRPSSGGARAGPRRAAAPPASARRPERPSEPPPAARTAAAGGVLLRAPACMMLIGIIHLGILRRYVPARSHTHTHSRRRSADYGDGQPDTANSREGAAHHTRDLPPISTSFPLRLVSLMRNSPSSSSVMVAYPRPPPPPWLPLPPSPPSFFCRWWGRRGRGWLARSHKWKARR